jgi:hypothetical protein
MHEPSLFLSGPLVFAIVSEFRNPLSVIILLLGFANPSQRYPSAVQGSPRQFFHPQFLHLAQDLEWIRCKHLLETGSE